MIAWYLALLLLLAGLAWYPWCGETCADCNRCTSGTLVCSPSYTISGFADGACQCSRLDGSYILTQLSTDACKWGYPGPGEYDTTILPTGCTDAAYDLLYNLWAYVDYYPRPYSRTSVQIRTRTSIYRVPVGDPYSSYARAHFAYYYYTDPVEFPPGEYAHHDCSVSRTCPWFSTSGSPTDDPCALADFMTATVIWQ